MNMQCNIIHLHPHLPSSNVKLGFTASLWVLQQVFGFYSKSLGFTASLWVLQQVFGFYSKSLSFTASLWVLQQVLFPSPYLTETINKQDQLQQQTQFIYFCHITTTLPTVPGC